MKLMTYLIKRIECGFKDHDHYGLFMEINSIYFHSKGTQRFWKNNIDDIRNSSRHWTTDSKEVADCLISYCQILLSSTGNSEPKETINIISLRGHLRYE